MITVTITDSVTRTMVLKRNDTLFAVIVSGLELTREDISLSTGSQGWWTESFQLKLPVALELSG